MDSENSKGKGKAKAKEKKKGGKKTASSSGSSSEESGETSSGGECILEWHFAMYSAQLYEHEFRHFNTYWEPHPSTSTLKQNQGLSITRTYNQWTVLQMLWV